MDYVRDVPYGLVVCHVDGRQAAVTGLGDGGLVLRTAERGHFGAVLVRFLDPKRGEYVPFWTQNGRILAQKRTGLGWETELSLPDPAFTALARRALHAWADFVRDRLAGEYGFPDGFTSPTLTRQKELWFGPWTAGPGETGADRVGGAGTGEAGEWEAALAAEWELALSLDGPKWYGAFIEDPDGFQERFLTENRLMGHPLFERRAGRIYVGNAWCERLFPAPETLRRILGTAEAAGLHVTLVLPTLRGEIPDWMEKEALCHETAVNDWGTLFRLAKKRQAGKGEIILGTLMNRRRKDPRIEETTQTGGGLFRGTAPEENGLNDPLFAGWLKEMGVHRYEYEACGYPVKAAGKGHSLHLPFYQTNTSHDCVLAAACQGRDMGVAGGECMMECQKAALLFPDQMGMVGRYNSLFALDRGILAHPGALMEWLNQGTDRLVVEGL